MHKKMSELVIKDVCKSYNQQDIVLKNCSLNIHDGDFVAIMGRSGSGKTTLLNVASTLDRVDSGNIYFGDTDITIMDDFTSAEFRKNDLGFVFQDYMLLDSLTIRQNIAVSLSLIKYPKHKINRKIDEFASFVGLEEHLEKYPYQLSGGQKQRVSIIRAIIKEPLILFADEPTGALDSESSKIIMETLAKINSTLNTTIVMVTHDNFSASFAKRVILLKDGQVEQDIKMNDPDYQLVKSHMEEG